MAEAGVMRRAATWTAALAALCAGIAGQLSGTPMALGILAGSAVGLVNFWLLARVLGRMMSDPERYRGDARAVIGPMLLKWPLLLAMLAFVIIVLPVRAEGVAIGTLISLLSLVIAGLAERSQAGDQPPPA